MSELTAGLRKRLRSAMNADLKDDPAEGLFDREGLTEDMLDIVMPIIEADLKAQIAGARHEGKAEGFSESYSIVFNTCPKHDSNGVLEALEMIAKAAEYERLEKQGEGKG